MIVQPMLNAHMSRHAGEKPMYRSMHALAAASPMNRYSTAQRDAGIHNTKKCRNVTMPHSCYNVFETNTFVPVSVSDHEPPSPPARYTPVSWKLEQAPQRPQFTAA